MGNHLSRGARAAFLWSNDGVHQPLNGLDSNGLQASNGEYK
jgi:hypothetical protein